MTIAEVVNKYGLSADTLRYYERVGIIPPVPRKNGIRNYDDESCRWIELMRCLRSAGVSIDALIEFVTLYLQGDSTAAARKAILVEQREILRERLDKLKATLKRLDYKIENYDKILAGGNLGGKKEIDL